MHRNDEPPRECADDLPESCPVCASCNSDPEGEWVYPTEPPFCSQGCAAAYREDQNRADEAYASSLADEPSREEVRAALASSFDARPSTEPDTDLPGRIARLERGLRLTGLAPCLMCGEWRRAAEVASVPVGGGSCGSVCLDGCLRGWVAGAPRPAPRNLILAVAQSWRRTGVALAAWEDLLPGVRAEVRRRAR